MNVTQSNIPSFFCLLVCHLLYRLRVLIFFPNVIPRALPIEFAPKLEVSTCSSFFSTRARRQAGGGGVGGRSDADKTCPGTGHPPLADRPPLGHSYFLDQNLSRLRLKSAQFLMHAPSQSLINQSIWAVLRQTPHRHRHITVSFNLRPPSSKKITIVQQPQLLHVLLLP